MAYELFTVVGIAKLPEPALAITIPGFHDLGARFAAQYLALEIAAGSAAPLWLRRMLIIGRQRRGYTRGDGITRAAVAGVEAIYRDTLHHLQAVLTARSFVLGECPSLADVAMCGPFFRHFGTAPVPADTMRAEAPAVYAWLGRMWDYRAGAPDELLPSLPGDWLPLLRDIGRPLLPYLIANHAAVHAGHRRFDVTVDGVAYRGARASRYRVWCLARLRRAYRTLEPAAAAEVRAIFEEAQAWESPWAAEPLRIDPSLCSQLPFRVDVKMLEVYR